MLITINRVTIIINTITIIFIATIFIMTSILHFRDENLTFNVD